MKKNIEKRMKIEKHRADTHKTEVSYKRGKYIGLRYALDILTKLNQKDEK